MSKRPYKVIKFRYVTEKARMLQELQHSNSNRCISKCQKPKFVFIVDRCSNKQEIALAIEEIYQERKIKVITVNTINHKGKKRKVRGRVGRTAAFKKAIVTLEPGDTLDEQV